MGMSVIARLENGRLLYRRTDIVLQDNKKTAFSNAF